MSIKKFLSTKMAITIVAGAVAGAVVIGGTFAWFTARAEAESTGSFNTGKLEVTFTAEDYYAVDFYPGHGDTILAQKDLEERAAYAISNPYDEGAIMDSFNEWFSNNFDVDNVFDVNDVPAATLDNDNVYFIQDSQGRAGGDGHIYNVMPGSILNAKYKIDLKDSYTSAYFRVKAIDLAQTNGWLYSTLIASFEFEGATGTYDFEMKYYDGWYYCPVPLMQVDGSNVDLLNNVSLTMRAYLYGAQNTDASKSVQISFGASEVELIQTANNAVYLVDGWKDVVDADWDYMPYINADLYQEYLASWDANSVDPF